MKIGLLTMVFNNNYGGMMQAYALQSYLKSLGHDVVLINAQVRKPPIWKIPFSVIKRLANRFLFGRRFDSIIPSWAYHREINKKEENTSAFVSNYITPKTKKVFSNRGIKNVCKEFDLLIVGSDQVWRPTMYPYINSAFFGFANNEKVKKISYAASFGVENWEYTFEQTKLFSKEIRNFNHISVREKSGVELCKKYFGVDANLVVDPTLLISKSEYLELIPNDEYDEIKPGLFCYLLDYTIEKEQIAKNISKQLGLTESHFLKEKESRTFKFPSVTEWLASFSNAEFVFTDSYHGCLFSLIFKKPFIVIGNNVRGMERFSSLLDLVNLNHRLILSLQDIDKVELQSAIDWKNVSDTLNELITFSKQYLFKALNE